MKQISVITMCLLASVGAWAETLKGKVIDQDAQPVVGATIECVHYMESDSILLASTVSDAEGNWELNYEFAWQGIKIEATKEGHTSYACYLDVSEKVLWPKFIFRLFNAINYKAGKRSTIYLPVAPNSSWGRFYRLDREEENKVIFERELAPKAYVPYVFFPYQDLHIDISGMDLSDHRNRVNLQRISLCGQINYMASEEDPGSLITWLLDESLSYVEYSEEGAYENSGFLPPMHAILSWMYTDFFEGNDEDDTWEAVDPELVFHDSEEDIPTYHTFVKEGKMWRTVVMGQGDNYNRFYEYWFQGDAIVGGQKCKIMNRSELSYDIDPSCPAAVNTTFMGVLYEKDGKVYYAAPDQSDFSLLYDFSAPIGTAFKMGGDVVTIIKKERQQDAVFKGEKTYVQRKSLGLFTCWLEAVGNSSSPINNINGECATGEEDLISCMVGDEVLYYDEEMVHAITGTDNPEVKKKWLDFTHTVKTRPKAPERGVKSEKSDDDLVANSEEETVTGEYSVKALFVNFTTLAGPYAITITDAAGQEVYRKVVQTSNVVALNTDISAYPKGSYTLTVENEEEVYAALLNINDENSLSPTPSPAREGSAGAVYNLSGQRLTVPRRGVNIIDGKKVAIK